MRTLVTERIFGDHSRSSKDDTDREAIAAAERASQHALEVALGESRKHRFRLDPDSRRHTVFAAGD